MAQTTALQVYALPGRVMSFVAKASAGLSAPLERVYAIPREARVLAVANESRVYPIAIERRVFPVE